MAWDGGANCRGEHICEMRQPEKIWKTNEEYVALPSLAFPFSICESRRACYAADEGNPDIDGSDCGASTWKDST